MLSNEDIKRLLPLASEWVTEKETEALQTGMPLSSTQLTDAKTIGIQHPERIRILLVDTVPVPEVGELHFVLQKTQMLPQNAIGITFGYGIYIQKAHQSDRSLLVHEMTHTMQYERLGGIAAFLEQYIHECLSVGYFQAPMEVEAREVTLKICG